MTRITRFFVSYRRVGPRNGCSTRLSLRIGTGRWSPTKKKAGSWVRSGAGSA